ncbi:hypothetical protein KVT40_001708 [Elsinoe batatas]|uniref:Alpha-L-rhamnosidase C-terminal domain-containing protein n=1 Tax=Elsinoe batatas TaxID=2601811 RepID=A0A8K0PLL7_9PEZI|nr:hypothetical protein KVT40_001708 [Elsinoe batatas]
MKVSDLTLVFLVGLTTATTRSHKKGDDFYPSSYAVGNDYNINTTQRWKSGISVTLDARSSVATLDYQDEFAGFPFLDVLDFSGTVQVELKYGESFVSLEAPFADGPWTFVQGLSNTFRTETFDVTKHGRLDSFFIQGGQRWESIRLLTNGTVTLRAGHRLSTDHTPLYQLPGSFSSSNRDPKAIFDLESRATQEITEDGALIRGQTTSQSVKGVTFANYTLNFRTKIVRGGTAFRITSGTAPYGAYFVLVSSRTNLVNTNRTLLPANSLIYNYGWNIINQTTLAIPEPQVQSLNVSIEEGQWYNISASIEPTGYRVWLDDQQIGFFSNQQAFAAVNPFFGGATPYEGTWGFGPSLEQDAYFRDVVITAANGSTLYENALTGEDTLKEYSVTGNQNSVCMDGGKRDRLVWIGDFYHTARVVLATTVHADYFLGTIKQAFDFVSSFPTTAGFAAMPSPLGADPEAKNALGPAQYALTDYQDLFLISIAEYYHKTGDLALLQRFWPNMKAAMNRRLTFNDPADGLSTNGGYFLGPDKGAAPTALNVLALQYLIPLAAAVGDNATAQQYSSSATLGISAVQSLWSPSLGGFSLSPILPNDFSPATIAFVLRANIANATQAASILDLLSQLQVGVGYKDSTLVNSSSETQLSANIAGFLLEAIFESHERFNTTLEPARFLLGTFWPKMIDDDRYRSGASWEYLYPDGSPGISLFTSLSHPWGATPSYVLPRYVLGVKETKPGFEEWEMKPPTTGLGLTWAKGKVPTPRGSIQAQWKLNGKKLTVEVQAPRGTKGRIMVGYRIVNMTGGKKAVVHF